MAFLPSWNKRNKLIIDNTKIDVALTDFPVLVKINSDIINFSEAKSDGTDIRFTSSDGTTLLDFERVYHDSIGETAQYWVKIPSVSSSVDTEFYVYWDNAVASDDEDKINTWSNGYELVCHLNDDANNNDVEDSLGTSPGDLRGGDNTNDISTVGNIYKALLYDGIADYVEFVNTVELQVKRPMTGSSWIKRGSTANADIIFNKRGKAGVVSNRGWGFSINSSHQLSLTFYGVAGITSTSTINDTNWHRVSFTIDSSGNVNFYIDDANAGTASLSAPISNNDELTLGASHDGDGNISGYTNTNQEEALLADVERSSAWEKASYYSDINGLISALVLPFEVGDTVTLSDEIEIDVSLEKVTLGDTVNLSDDILTGYDDEIVIGDDIVVGYSEKVDLENDFRTLKLELTEFNNKVNTVIEVVSNLLNRIRTSLLFKLNISNKVSSVIQNDNVFRNYFAFGNNVLGNLTNDIRTLKLKKEDVTNDFRMIASFQTPGDAGFQSLGKDYVKVYIDSVEQTDIDIDSIFVGKKINSAHEAHFDLGRPYDGIKPDMKASVEIKYHIWTIYSGYISQINPTDDPETIRINCKDEYWEQNNTNKYFYVGHKPQEAYETYYDTPSKALISEFSYNPTLGEFVPETINCYTKPSSDCVTELITNSGNFGWYYDENKNKQLWVAGEGDIIGLEAQEIDKNLGLYQVVQHNITESVEGLINKYKVQMGDSVVRRYKKNIQVEGESQKASYAWVVFHFFGWHYKNIQVVAVPYWDSDLETLSKDTADGYGWDNPDPNRPNIYNNVYRRFKLPIIDEKYVSWSDRFTPGVYLSSPVLSTNSFANYPSGKIREGFTIDYLDGILTFNDKMYDYILDDTKGITETRSPIVTLRLWKKHYTSPLSSGSQNPEASPDPGYSLTPDDESYRMQFITDKIGNYSETIIGDLRLSGLSVQDGASYKDENDDWLHIPSWDDKPYAEDYAYWKLSQIADKKVYGNVEVTIDNILFNNITLSKRIMINGILENPLNIVAINYDFSTFTATISLENGRAYKRTTSLPNHKE